MPFRGVLHSERELLETHGNRALFDDEFNSDPTQWIMHIDARMRLRHRILQSQIMKFGNRACGEFRRRFDTPSFQLGTHK